MASIDRKVHFGECSVHPIDCNITEAERYATWYTTSEFNIIKASAYRMTMSFMEYGTPIRQTESIRGLEKLQTDRERMAKRKRNVLLSTIELQDMANVSGEKAVVIKTTLETYVRKHHKHAAERAESRAQEDYMAATEIYNETTTVEADKLSSPDLGNASLLHRHHSEAPAFKKQSLVAVSA